MTARKTARRTMANLYAGLTPDERARLMARLYREQDDTEFARLRESVPPSQADEYNRILHLLSTLQIFGAMGMRASWLGMERAGLFLAAEVSDFAKERRARAHAYTASRLLTGYPITESEYQALKAAHRSQLELLDTFAKYIGETRGDDDDPNVPAAVREWAESPMPDDIPEDEYWATVAPAELRAVLDAAIARGELPAPESTPQGPALPWGTLHDWLTGGSAETFTLYSPDYYIPSLEALSVHIGLEWDIRPDSEADDVRQRREHICHTLARVRELNETQLAQLQPHPPATMEQLREEQQNWETIWPPIPETEQRERLLALLAMYLDVQLEQLSLMGAFEVIQREDFHGEDPLPAHVRSMLEQAREANDRFRKTWAWVQEHVYVGIWGPDNTLPDIPEPDAEELEYLTVETVKSLRAFR